MQYFETIHKETAADFDIVFSITPEHEQPDWDFETEQDKQDTLRRIDNGELSWFIARVQAYKRGVLLGEAYLGGCCYDSPMQFVEAADYYSDMVEEAAQAARETLQKLCSCA